MSEKKKPFERYISTNEIILIAMGCMLAGVWYGYFIGRVEPVACFIDGGTP